MGNAHVLTQYERVENVLYEDKFIRIDTHGIDIYFYHFPGITKRFSYTEISEASSGKEMDLKWLDYRPHGPVMKLLSDYNIFWAADIRRMAFIDGSKRAIVLKVKDEMFFKGFSAVDPEKVLEIIRKQLEDVRSKKDD